MVNLLSWESILSRQLAIVKTVETKLSTIIADEKDWRQQTVEREKLMAELDDIEMSEDEIEAVVDAQIDSNPHRSKIQDLLKQLWSEY